MNTCAAQKGISNISIEVPPLLRWGVRNTARQFQQRNPSDLTIDGKNPIQQVLCFKMFSIVVSLGLDTEPSCDFTGDQTYRTTCLSDWLVSAGPFLSANDDNVDKHVKTFYRML